MKKIVDRVEEFKNDFFDTLKNSKEISVKSLQDFKCKLQNEINYRVDSFYKIQKLRSQLSLDSIRKLHKKSLVSFWFMVTHPNIKLILSIPFIYSMIFPALILDIFLEIYHRICFPLYGIPLVKRKDYFVIDRHLLGYLNWFEKINCLYCSYFNNLIAYTREIAGRTEKFWCPIKHSRRIPDEHSHYKDFAEYLDGEDFRKKFNNKECFKKSFKEDVL